MDYDYYYKKAQHKAQVYTACIVAADVHGSQEYGMHPTLVLLEYRRINPGIIARVNTSLLLYRYESKRLWI